MSYNNNSNSNNTHHGSSSGSYDNDQQRRRDRDYNRSNRHHGGDHHHNDNHGSSSNSGQHHQRRHYHGSSSSSSGSSSGKHYYQNNNNNNYNNNYSRPSKQQPYIPLPDKYLMARDCYTLETVQQRFKQLQQNYKVELQDNPKDTIKRFQGSHAMHLNGNHVAVVARDNFDDSELITDYFVEDVRCESYNVNFKSPMKIFEQDKKHWAHKYRDGVASAYVDAEESNKDDASKLKLKQRCYAVFRELMRKGAKRDCALFPLSVPLGVYKLLKPRNILDMCAGWGDRLICAMLYGAENYVGVDPNGQLAPKYKTMVDALGNGDHSRFKVVQSPFEDITDEQVHITTAQLPGGGDSPTAQFDMMFSSPPYFVAEHYSSDDQQSHNRYKNNLDAWLNGFMFPSIEKAWRYLRNGAFYCLVLSDVQIDWKEINYTEQVLNHIEKQPGAQYYGMFKYNQLNVTVQPIWMFRKLVLSETNDVEQNNSDNGAAIAIPQHLYDPRVEAAALKQQLKGTFYLDKNSNATCDALLDEDLLIGGTALRAFVPLIFKQKQKQQQLSTVTVDIRNESIVAIAHACKLAQVQCHLLYNEVDSHEADFKTDTMVQTARIFGAKLMSTKQQQQNGQNTYHISNEEYSTTVRTLYKQSAACKAIMQNLKNKMPTSTSAPVRIWTSSLLSYYAIHELASAENLKPQFMLIAASAQAKQAIKSNLLLGRTQCVEKFSATKHNATDIRKYILSQLQGSNELAVL